MKHSTPMASMINPKIVLSRFQMMMVSRTLLKPHRYRAPWPVHISRLFMMIRCWPWRVSTMLEAINSWCWRGLCMLSSERIWLARSYGSSANVSSSSSPAAGWRGLGLKGSWYALYAAGWHVLSELSVDNNLAYKKWRVLSVRSVYNVPKF